MPDAQRLRGELRRIDGRPYPAYRDLRGTWRLGALRLRIDHVQGDPFASPSRVRLRVPTDARAAGPDRIAVEDFLLRSARKAVAAHSSSRGSGKSGRIEILAPGPEITERSAVRLLPGGTAELRLAVGLPAKGRRVLGQHAASLLFEDLGAVAAAVADLAGLDAHVHSAAVQRSLRAQLSARGLVAFLADGSLLPRHSGVDPRPLGGALPLRAPDSLAVELDTVDGAVRGLGIPEGVTVIVGGGFHGKSTLLAALARGHLDHVPGDGRERVVALEDTVKLRAEDGRRVSHVDISGFLGALPGGRDTVDFSTEDASGSTSQAAAIVEAIEAGARCVLFDEDTCATNLMVRDPRMRAVVPAEPITPLVERVRSLWEDHGVSTILVIGGVADYLGVADTVIAMRDFAPEDATASARALGIDIPRGPLPVPGPRRIEQLGLGDKVRARDTRAVRVGRQEIDLAAVDQVLDTAHATTLGEALRFVDRELVQGERTLPQILDMLDSILDDEGVEALSSRDWPDGRLVRPRRHEIAAAINRLRTAAIQPGR